MASLRFRPIALIMAVLLLSIGTGVISGCESKDDATPKTTDKMKGGGPPIPGSQRPANAPQAR